MLFSPLSSLLSLSLSLCFCLPHVLGSPDHAVMTNCNLRETEPLALIEDAGFHQAAVFSPLPGLGRSSHAKEAEAPPLPQSKEGERERPLAGCLPLGVRPWLWGPPGQRGALSPALRPLGPLGTVTSLSSVLPLSGHTLSCQPLLLRVRCSGSASVCREPPRGPALFLTEGESVKRGEGHRKPPEPHLRPQSWPAHLKAPPTF